MEVKSHRERQALATKTQIATAARRLFAEQGYVATTISAIAEASDIPVQTIYSAFGNKGAILRALAAETLGALDSDAAHDAAIEQRDPAAGLRAAAALHRRRFEVMYDVIAIHLEAARTDADIAAVVHAMMTAREESFRRQAESIAEHLRDGVGVAEAVDRCMAVTHPVIYRTLVRERGWSLDRYQDWLGGTLIEQLL